MSIPQPTLDDRTYADLLEGARALIPSLAPQWTNHNPSDPGITLIELFAWLTEMLIYRVDRLPEANTHTFLRLLNGPLWKPGPDLAEDIRATVLDLRRRHRAVTAEDYEALAREASPGVARVRCVPRRNLVERTEMRRLAPRESDVSVILVPDRAQAGAEAPVSWPGAPLPSSALLDQVDTYLLPRRLITVRQHIAPPIYVPIQAEMAVAARPDADPPELRKRLTIAFREYLDALRGGPEGSGWPFGRDVYVSELYHLLEKIPGVDYVIDVTLSSACPADAPRCVAGTELWHEQGDQIGIELAVHHLPWVPPAPEDPDEPQPVTLAIGSAVLPIRIAVEVAARSEFASSAARRAVKSAVKRLFHPLHFGLGGNSLWEITGSEIADEVERLPEIEEVKSIVLEAGPGRRFEQGGTAGVRFEAGEMANVTVTVLL